MARIENVFQDDDRLPHAGANEELTSSTLQDRLISSAGHQLIVMPEGNLAVYMDEDTSQEPVWSTNTQGQGRGPFRCLMHGTLMFSDYLLLEQPGTK